MEWSRRRTVVLTTVAAIAVGTAAFVVVREVSSNESAGAQPATPEASATAFDPTPDLTVTPEPDLTPDLAEPGWYVPYLNRDRELPRFEGEINGILITGNPPPPEFPKSAVGTCDSGLERQFGAQADAEWSFSAVGLDRGGLPADQELFDEVVYTICGDTEAVSMKATVAVTVARAGTDLGAGSIRVYRWIGPGYSGFTAAEERWFGADVAGFPAAVLRPVIESVGNSAIIVHDPRSGVTTSLVGEGVYLESLESLMEEILR